MPKENKNSKAICSFFDNKINTWKQLKCKSGSQLDLFEDETSITCCTPHLTSFAAIDQAYYASNDKKLSKYLKFSIIPSLVILLFLVAPLIFRKCSMDKGEEDENLREPQPKQVNNTTNLDISSKSPNHDEVSEFEISPTKMNPDGHHTEVVTTAVDN